MIIMIVMTNDYNKHGNSNDSDGNYVDTVVVWENAKKYDIVLCIYNRY